MTRKRSKEEQRNEAIEMTKTRYHEYTKGWVDVRGRNLESGVPIERRGKSMNSEFLALNVTLACSLGLYTDGQTTLQGSVSAKLLAKLLLIHDGWFEVPSATVEEELLIEAVGVIVKSASDMHTETMHTGRSLGNTKRPRFKERVDGNV